MNKQPTFSYLWPTLFGTFYNPDHENMKKDLLKFFEEYKKKNPSRKSGENHKLYESKYDLHSQQGTVFQKLLKNFITKAFFEMSKQANKDFAITFKGKEMGVTITDSWFIHYEKGGFVLPHAHGQCSWCCVYYVQVGKDATKTNGGTYFQKPIPNRHTLDYGSYYNKFLQAQFTPEEGKMLIWPSYVMHGSYPYEGTEDRIIVSANAQVSVMESGRPIKTL